MASAEDYIEEARAESEGGLLGFIFALVVMACCGNTSKYAQQAQKPEKVPDKIEHHSNPAMDQFYRARQSYLIHVR